jgi:hypothetical protein
MSAEVEVKQGSVILGVSVGKLVGAADAVGASEGDGEGGDDGTMVLVGNNDSVGETDNVGSADGYIDMVGDIGKLVGTADAVGASEGDGEWGGDGTMVLVGNNDSVGETDNVGSADGDIDMVGDKETVGMPEGAEETVGEIESVGRAVGRLDGLEDMDGLPDGRGEVVGRGSVGTNERDALGWIEWVGDSEGDQDDIILSRIKILPSSTVLLSLVSFLLASEGMKMPRAAMMASKAIINTSVHLLLEIKDPRDFSNSRDGFEAAELGDPALSNIRSSSSSCAMDSCGPISSSSKLSWLVFK